MKRSEIAVDNENSKSNNSFKEIFREKANNMSRMNSNRNPDIADFSNFMIKLPLFFLIPEFHLGM